MSTDPNSKTIRQFRCRDYLWETFEEMGRELGCSPDYLINEAMRLYARSREYGTHNPSIAPRPGGSARPGTGRSQPAGARPSSLVPPPSAPAGGLGGAAPSTRPTELPAGFGSHPPPPPSRSAGYRPPPPPGVSMTPPPPISPRGAPSIAPPPGRPGTAPPTSSGMQTAPVGLESPRQTILRGNAVPRPPRRSSVPPAPPPVTGAGGALPPSAPTLRLVFNGEKIPIDKTEFVIGRGSKTSDLAIKDGNISRRHCAVVFENGSYVIRDLGSTNGVEHAGRRIDQKEIDEGDIFQLCDYELRFTFR